jgi:hypothetical protein
MCSDSSSENNQKSRDPERIRTYAQPQLPKLHAIPAGTGRGDSQKGVDAKHK